jgi:hypothetical protein
MREQDLEILRSILDKRGGFGEDEHLELTVGRERSDAKSLDEFVAENRALLDRHLWRGRK